MFTEKLTTGLLYKQAPRAGVVPHKKTSTYVTRSKASNQLSRSGVLLPGCLQRKQQNAHEVRSRASFAVLLANAFSDLDRLSRKSPKVAAKAAEKVSRKRAPQSEGAGLFRPPSYFIRLLKRKLERAGKARLAQNEKIPTRIDLVVTHVVAPRPGAAAGSAPQVPVQTEEYSSVPSRDLVVPPRRRGGRTGRQAESGSITFPPLDWSGISVVEVSLVQTLLSQGKAREGGSPYGYAVSGITIRGPAASSSKTAELFSLAAQRRSWQACQPRIVAAIFPDELVSPDAVIPVRKLKLLGLVSGYPLPD